MVRPAVFLGALALATPAVARDSLVLGHGISDPNFIVAIISLALTAGLFRVMSVCRMWLVAVLIPFAVAYALYWVPVWIKHRADPDFSRWASFVITFWAVPSAVACLLLVGVLAWRCKGTSDNRRKGP